MKKTVFSAILIWMVQPINTCTADKIVSFLNQLPVDSAKTAKIVMHNDTCSAYVYYWKDS